MIAIDVFVGTPMVVWAVVHAIRAQSHPLSLDEAQWWLLGGFTEFWVGALFLYGFVRSLLRGWLWTYRRVERLAVVSLMVACPAVVLVVAPPTRDPAPVGLLAVPVVVLWLQMMRDLARGAWRALA